jgi:hypothetical protein
MLAVIIVAKVRGGRSDGWRCWETQPLRANFRDSVGTYVGDIAQAAKQLFRLAIEATRMKEKWQCLEFEDLLVLVLSPSVPLSHMTLTSPSPLSLSLFICFMG